MQAQPFTYGNIITAAQLLALNSPTPPAPGDQQYQIYALYINYLAIMSWENQRNVLWNELWVDEPAYATIQAGTTSIQLPSDFKFIGGGFVRINYPGTPTAVRPTPVKRLVEIELNPYNNQKEFYVQGNIQQGFNLLLGWTPAPGDPEVGATISFRYYKYANIAQLNSQNVLVNPSDIPEMSNPMYVFQKVTAAVAAANYNTNLYQIYEAAAADSLVNMITANEMSSNYMDNYVKDVDYLLGISTAANYNRFNSLYWTGGAGQ